MSEEQKSWQPIETAPKTGEHVLVVGGTFGICGGKEQAWMDVAHYWNYAGEEGFYPSYGPDQPLKNLTHWMPLPDPPTT
jgi:hypothetical protein